MSQPQEPDPQLQEQDGREKQEHEGKCAQDRSDVHRHCEGRAPA